MLDPKDCLPGQEQYEEFYSPVAKKNLVQYDYRHTSGELFSCVAFTLEKCRLERDNWFINYN